ncbi:MAG: carboxypeptidase regulatory-like domain-containing protein, partial [Pyrinomonadaceae bacterium]
DNRPVGVVDTINVPDDFEIADVDVRIDSLPHTCPGDLTFSVKGPNNYGTDFLAFLGGAVSGGGDGNDITNIRFDDEAAGDVLLATNAMAPYTGSWKPIFNSPTWTPLGFPGPDGTPQLSNFDGSSSLGAWRAIVSDQAGVDTGTLQGWSLIVTPRNFVCTPYVQTAAGVSVSGRVVDRYGRAIAQVLVKLTSDTGESVVARTNTFGYFRLPDVPAGQTYVLAGEARRYTFQSRLLNVNDEVTGLELVAD